LRQKSRNVPKGDRKTAKTGSNVIDRKRAEDLLRASELKYRSLFEEIPHPIYQSSPEGKLLTVNPAFKKLLGYDSDSELAVIDVERDLYVNPEDRKRWSVDVQARGEVHDVELTLKRRNGEKISVLDSAYAVRDRNGTIQYYQGTLTDITERKRAQEKLREASRLNSLLLDSLPNPTVLADDHQVVIAANKAAINLGVQVGKPCWEGFCKGKYREACLAQRAIDENQSQHCETKLFDRVWDTFWVPVAKDAYLHYLVDITDRKRAEEKLKESSENLERMVAERTAKLAEAQNQLQVITDSLPAVISYVDSEQRYRFSNKTYEEWFGQARTAIIGRHVREVLGEQAYKRIQARVEAALSGVPQTFEYELPIRLGTRNISANYIPDFGEHSEVKGLFVLGIDITERKKMQERLLNAEHLAAIGETAAMVGHDLRNPLQGIMSATYILRKSMGPAADNNAREAIDLIEKDVDQSKRIITDLLDYAREIKLESSETTPSSLIKNALDQVGREVSSNIKLLHLAKDEPVMIADCAKMQRVIVNLVNNALDAMPQGGTLSLSSSTEDGKVEISVADTGTGITEEVMQKIWTPLFTTKQKGMGLGLPICKRIVEAHGGSISIESTLGKGSTFTIRLPAKPKSVA